MGEYGMVFDYKWVCLASDGFRSHAIGLLLWDRLLLFALFAANGTVRRFWASFEQRCHSRTEALRGEIRVTNVPTYGTVSTCTVR